MSKKQVYNLEITKIFIFIFTFSPIFFNQTHCMRLENEKIAKDSYFNDLVENTNTELCESLGKKIVKITLNKMPKKIDIGSLKSKIESITKRQFEALDKDLLKNKFENEEDMYSWEASFKSSPISIDNYKNEMIRQKEPDLCLFKECDCQNTSHEERIKLEKLILEHKNLKTLGQELNYMSFGPGQLLQDLKIITDLISTKNKKFKTIHLIDTDYDKNLLIDFLEITSDKKKLESIDPENFTKIIRLAQFVKVISEMQNEPIVLMLYQDLCSYIQYCEKDQKSLADIATAIDIELSNEITKDEDYDAHKNPKKTIFESGLKENGMLCCEKEDKIQVKKLKI